MPSSFQEDKPKGTLFWCQQVTVKHGAGGILYLCYNFIFFCLMNLCCHIYYTSLNYKIAANLIWILFYDYNYVNKPF